MEGFIIRNVRVGRPPGARLGKHARNFSVRNLLDSVRGSQEQGRTALGSMSVNCYICGHEKAGSRCVRCKKNVCENHHSYIETRIICDFCGAAELRQLEEESHALEKQISQTRTRLEELYRRRSKIDAPDSPYSQSAATKGYLVGFVAAAILLALLLAIVGWVSGADFKVAHYLLSTAAVAAVVLPLMLRSINKKARARSAQHRAVAESINEGEALLSDLERRRENQETIIKGKKADIARLTLE